MNFSSNIVYEVKGAGSEEAGMIKSVNSVFENTVIADSMLGQCPKSPFATDNLLENTDGGTHSNPMVVVVWGGGQSTPSVCVLSGRQPATF